MKAKRKAKEMTGYEKALRALKGTDAKLRQMAIVWFHDKYDSTPAELCNMGCKLKPATISTYFRKFVNLLSDAIARFIDDTKKVYRRIVKSTTHYWCYIDKITMPNGEVWTKIGQTTQTPEERARGFAWGPKNAKVRPLKTEVQARFNCKDEESMTTLENLLRYAMMSINPLKFEMNDRLLEYKDNYPELICNHSAVQENLAALLAA